MRNRVLAGVLAAGVALVMATPAASEAGHCRSSQGRSYGRSWHGRHYVRPHVSFAYRSYVPYVPYASYGYRPYGYYDPYYSNPYYSDPYYSYGYQPYYRPRPVFVPRVYYGPRPFYRGYRGRPYVSIRLGF
jgi:hypothetical protein